MSKIEEALRLLREDLGNWWTDDRKKWCAYCGRPMKQKPAAKGTPLRATHRTRDHVIPRKHGGGGITIPACHECNKNKGSGSLGDFLKGAYLEKRRKHRHRNKWPMERLWVAEAVAALSHSSNAASQPVRQAPATPDQYAP